MECLIMVLYPVHPICTLAAVLMPVYNLLHARVPMWQKVILGYALNF